MVIACNVSLSLSNAHRCVSKDSIELVHSSCNICQCIVMISKESARGKKYLLSWAKRNALSFECVSWTKDYDLLETNFVVWTFEGWRIFDGVCLFFGKIKFSWSLENYFMACYTPFFLKIISKNLNDFYKLITKIAFKIVFKHFKQNFNKINKSEKPLKTNGKILS